MDHNSFFKAIKNDSLSGAYLLHGEEEFIKDAALKALLESVEEAARALNVEDLATGEAEPLIAACETLPFFAKRRLVICRSIPTEENYKRISAYLPHLPESSLLIFFVRGTASGTSGLVKLLKKEDRLVDCSPLDETGAVHWVEKQARLRGYIITQAAARHLVALCGTDLTILNNEYIKAASYAGAGREITKEIIAKAVTRNLEFDVFEMVDAFAAGKSAAGMQALSALLERESAIGIAALLSNRFKQMLQARLLLDKGLDKQSAIKRMGGHPFAAKKACEAASRFPREKLMKIVKELSDVSYMQISGQGKDRDVLELSLLRLGTE